MTIIATLNDCYATKPIAQHCPPARLLTRKLFNWFKVINRQTGTCDKDATLSQLSLKNGLCSGTAAVCLKALSTYVKYDAGTCTAIATVAGGVLFKTIQDEVAGFCTAYNTNLPVLKASVHKKGKNALKKLGNVNGAFKVMKSGNRHRAAVATSQKHNGGSYTIVMTPKGKKGLRRRLRNDPVKP